MAETSSENPKNNMSRRLLLLIGIIAALGIAVVWFVSKPSETIAQECSVSPETIAALDEVTIGQLAAMLPTGTGRGYSDMAFIDWQGNELSIADYAGKPLLVNFWATWCGPCREEMPALNALSMRYADSPFEVVTIDLDTGDGGLAKAKAFLDENGLDALPLLGDPTFAAFDRLKNSGVSLGLPTTLLLDGNGCELAVLQGPAVWDGDDAIALIEKLIELVG